MLKTFKLFDVGKVFFGQMVVKRSGWIYDYRWKMAFKSEKYRQEFLDKIKRAQEHIKEGKYITLEEFNKKIDDMIY